MAYVGSRFGSDRAQFALRYSLHAILDAPDQPAIVRQYMRYTGQIMSGKSVAKTVMRAVQL